MCAKWNVRQATLQQMFKVAILCVDTCFQSFFVTDQLHSPPLCAKIQPMSQEDASAQLIRIAVWYSICVKKMKKMKICAFYKVVR